MSGPTARVPKGWEERLLDALIKELQGSREGFAEQISKLVKELDPGAEGNPWHPALAVLHRQLLPWLASDPAMCSRAEELLQEVQALVAEAVEDSQIHHRLMIDRRRRSLSEATELLSAAFDLESPATALRKSMPRLLAFAAELATSVRPPRTLLISGRLPGEPGGPTLPNGAAFLQKPFGVAALLDAVRATLDSPPAT